MQVGLADETFSMPPGVVVPALTEASLGCPAWMPSGLRRRTTAQLPICGSTVRLYARVSPTNQESGPPLNSEDQDLLWSPAHQDEHLWTGYIQDADDRVLMVIQ